MLEEVEEKGLSDVVSWLPHGRSFRVHKMERFVAEVLPKWFAGQTKWDSFSRQCQLYGKFYLSKQKMFERMREKNIMFA